MPKASTHQKRVPAGASEGANAPSEAPLRIGVISDTHGYLDPHILELFAGVDLILHAGDVGGPGILDVLRTVAPVMAVAGNLHDDDALGLPTERKGDVGGVRLVVGHKRKRVVKRLVSGNEGEFDLVVFGHDHVPSASWVEGTLWLNPGSASAPYEEDELPTVAVVERTSTGLSVLFVPLSRRKPQAPSPPTKRDRGKARGS